MKKISVIVLSLCVSAAAFSQNQPKLRTDMARAVRFGIKAGVNIAKLNVDEAPGINSNTKTSMGGGFLVNIPVGSGGMAVQPELLYNGYGGKLSETPTLGGTQRYEQDMHYISLPIMLQWRSTPGFYVELGPQVSYLFRATQDNGTTDVSNKDDFDNFDIAAAGGIGYMSRIGLGVGARYNYGLSNVLEDGGGNNSSNNGPELKNRVLHIGLFYQFGAAK
ncbi:MAG: porin family protein [Flavisolibacter sp.]